MAVVTVSPKYQIVIPREIRDAMGIQPGQKVELLRDQGRIVLVPVVPMESLRGFARGLDTAVERDRDRF